MAPPAASGAPAPLFRSLLLNQGPAVSVATVAGGTAMVASVLGFVVAPVLTGLFEDAGDSGTQGLPADVAALTQALQDLAREVTALKNAINVLEGTVAKLVGGITSLGTIFSTLTQVLFGILLLGLLLVAILALVLALVWLGKGIVRVAKSP